MVDVKKYKTLFQMFNVTIVPTGMIGFHQKELCINNWNCLQETIQISESIYRQQNNLHKLQMDARPESLADKV